MADARTGYDADAITKLEGRDAVRMRPGMYIGGSDARALNHLFIEILDNAVDEHLAGHCTEIVVTVEGNVIAVADNGRGIPVGKNSDGEHAVHLVFEDLHAGGKFDSDSYKFSGGLHGVGASVANFLSKWLDVTVRREGHEWTVRYEDGYRKQAVTKGKKAKGTGTTISWLYDDTVFKGVKHIDPSAMEQVMRDRSYLAAGLKLILRVDDQPEKVFFSKDGLAGYAKDLAADHRPVHPAPLHFQADTVTVTRDGQPDELGVEVAIQWVADAKEVSYSFANVIHTEDGGQHVAGMRAAVTKAMNNYAYETGKLKKDKKDPDRFEGRDVFGCAVSLVAVRISDPQFQGQTKGRLNNPEAKTAVQTFLYEAFTDWLADPANAKAATAILERCLFARRRRISASKIDRSYSNDSIFADNGLGKLADCDGATELSERELFIVEGDSAGGSAKQARDRRTQAILPLRGVPINVLTATNDRVFDNTEVAALCAALGARVEEFEGERVAALDADQLRYSKVVILADADDDGAHITYMVLCTLWELFPDVVRAGRVFLSRPPLFKIDLDSRGESKAYAYTQQEMQQVVKRHKRDASRDVGRFKGLGEMNPDELAETVMDPQTRRLIQVSVQDAAEVADTFKLLLGRNADLRKDWIASGGADAALASIAEDEAA